jgi:hypothetical protein
MYFKHMITAAVLFCTVAFAAMGKPGCFSIYGGGPSYRSCSCACPLDHRRSDGQCMLCRHFSYAPGPLYTPPNNNYLEVAVEEFEEEVNKGSDGT